jgi:NFACT protein RNA binding domain
VYLRLKKDQRLEDVSDKTVMECAQLVKANSIEGCKLKEVHVIYTRWSVTQPFSFDMSYKVRTVSANCFDVTMKMFHQDCIEH